MIAAAVGTFWRGTSRFVAIFGCMLLVTFDALRWLATEVGGVTNGLAVETLTHRTGVFKFFPCGDTMAEFTNLEHFANVSGRGEGNYKYGVFNHDSLCDPVQFSELRDPCYLYVVSVQISTNALFWDVAWDAFQYQPGFYSYW